MQPERICTLFFSPTGTSRKTATAVARGIAAPFAATADSTATDRATATADSSGTTDPANHAAEANRVAATPENGPIPVRALDLTHAAPRPETLSADTVAVFAAPVYGGRIPRTALERMEGIRGEGTPAVVMAVYGNRAFEKAAAELADFVRARGFVPVAAAAFVGEHSYSTERTPIAAGRPDGQDLAAAEAFGRAVRRKLAGQGPLPVARRSSRCCVSSVSFSPTGGARRNTPSSCCPQAARTAARTAAAARRSAPPEPSPAATNSAPTRPAASAAVPA